MRKGVQLILAVACCLLLNTAGWAWAGSIVGVVKPQGLRSPEGILVYVAKAPAGPTDGSQAKFIMDQTQLAFIPHILPVLVDSKVEFPNNDKVAHNVFSLSRAKKFNLGSYQPGEAKTVQFDQPGVVDLRCDVHQEMNAYILVLNNPYFALTDKEGRFTIPDQSYLGAHDVKDVPPLSPGKYLVKTWHEKLKTAKKKIEISAAGDTTIVFKPKRGAPGVLYK
ncbi:MAG: hypothetical protein JSU72_07275 [Deltaproteobacteria bacterium]|nr:MAG: hypothetical protein JSU72_07275 [Deltaproteobacteria bacterium]